MWIVNQGIIENKKFIYFENEEEAREFAKLTNSRAHPIFKIDKTEWPELIEYITVYADPRYFTEIQKDKNSFNIRTHTQRVYSTTLNTIKEGFTINSAMNAHGNAVQHFFNTTEEEAKKEFISTLNDKCKVVHIQEAMRPNFERIVEKDAAPPEGYSSKIVNGIEHWYTPDGAYRVPSCAETAPVPKNQYVKFGDPLVIDGYTNYAFNSPFSTNFRYYTASDVDTIRTTIRGIHNNETT